MHNNSKNTAAHISPQNPLSDMIRDELFRPSTFKIIFLPIEIQRRICAFYFSALSPLELTTKNAKQALHLETALPLSLALSMPTDIFYTYSTFGLSSLAPLDLLPLDVRTKIRRVRISWGNLDKNIVEWISMISSTLPSLTEMVIVVDLVRLGAMIREGWFDYLSDVTKKALKSGTLGDVLLMKVECGFWGFQKSIRKNNQATDNPRKLN